jgi:hypothetical protein
LFQCTQSFGIRFHKNNRLPNKQKSLVAPMNAGTQACVLLWTPAEPAGAKATVYCAFVQ